MGWVMIHFDRKGQPLAFKAWSALRQDERYVRVAHDVVAGVEVSTVWLGINLNFTGGKPKIFETLIRGGKRDYEQIRYSNEVDALAGHARVIVSLQQEQKSAS